MDWFTRYNTTVRAMFTTSVTRMIPVPSMVVAKDAVDIPWLGSWQQLKPHRPDRINDRADTEQKKEANIEAIDKTAVPHKPTDRSAIPHKPPTTERKHQEKDRSEIPHKQKAIPHKTTSKEKERTVITIEDDDEEDEEEKYDQEVIHIEQEDHDPIDVVQLKKDVPVVIEEMRRPSPKKMTSIENEKVRNIRSRNVKQNQVDTYAKQYPKPKEGRAERVTRRAALAGQVQGITSAWMVLTPWVSTQKKVFKKNEHRLQQDQLQVVVQKAPGQRVWSRYTRV